MTLISTIVENLKLNKKTRMVANTAIGRWGQNGASLLTFSETMTWKKYINSLMIGTENSPLEVRRKMVQEAFENNPDQVFPTPQYRAWYKNKIKEQNSTMEHLQEKAEDLERVKQYVGADKIQDIIDNVKEAERLQAEQKRLQRSYQNRMSR
jgi:nicotinic acid mononucleotide adenylyltransferase